MLLTNEQQFLLILPVSIITYWNRMDKYFSAPEAKLVLKFTPGGGRAGPENIKQPFEVLYQENRKPAIVSPADVRAKVDGPAKVTSQTRGAANKYAVYFKTDTPGRYNITVFVREYSETHTCTAAAATDPSKCYVQGSNRVKASSVYTCKVVLVDLLGNELTTGLGDNLEVGILGHEGSFANLTSTNNDDGTFTVSLDILKPGCDYELSLKVNGNEIGVSPWKIRAD